LVTPAAAARDYGVVVHGDPPQIDQVATEALRGSMRTRRDDDPATG
jgi:hypothetical protein